MNKSIDNGLAIVEKMLDRLNRFLNGLAGIAVAIITGLIVISSIMRYLVNRPLHFTEELSALLFMAISVLSISYVFRAGQHIRIRAIFDRLPSPLRGFVDLAADLSTIVFLFFSIYWTWVFAYETHEFGGTSPDAGIRLFPWMLLVPVSLFVLVLNLLVDTIGKARLLIFRQGG